MALKDDLSWGGAAVRVVLALVLVYATFNPTGVSWFHWAVLPVFAGGEAGGLGSVNALKVLAGLVLVIGWAICLKATQRSLGLLGSALVLGLLGTIVWLLIDWNVVNPRSSGAVGHIVIVALGVLLGIGMSWSHVSRKLTGQIDTDEVG